VRAVWAGQARARPAGRSAALQPFALLPRPRAAKLAVPPRCTAAVAMLHSPQSSALLHSVRALSSCLACSATRRAAHPVGCRPRRCCARAPRWRRRATAGAPARQVVSDFLTPYDGELLMMRCCPPPTPTRPAARQPPAPRRPVGASAARPSRWPRSWPAAVSGIAPAHAAAHAAAGWSQPGRPRSRPEAPHPSAASGTMPGTAGSRWPPTAAPHRPSAARAPAEAVPAPPPAALSLPASSAAASR